MSKYNLTGKRILIYVHFNEKFYYACLNIGWVFSCSLRTNKCTNKYCKFMLNYSDMFRC